MLGAIARYVSRHHVALLALFVALGGSAVAATFINGKSIKQHTLSENRLTPQAVASLKASDPAVDCAAAKAKPASYPTAPCRSRSEPVGDASNVGGIAVGTDGNPVIIHGGHPINLVRCNDPICAGGDDMISPVDADPSTDVGTHSSLAVGADGNPVIAYHDGTNADLKVVRCNDKACTGGNETISVVDSAGLVGKWASVAIGTDGNPVIAYYDEGNADLKVARCNDKACAGGNETRTPVDTSGDVGTYASVAVGLDGKPVVAYYDATNGDLKLARCNDLACAGQNERLAILDGVGDVGQYASVAIAVHGVPVVAYIDVTNSKLKVARPSIP